MQDIMKIYNDKISLDWKVHKLFEKYKDNIDYHEKINKKIDENTIKYYSYEIFPNGKEFSIWVNYIDNNEIKETPYIRLSTDLLLNK